MHVALHVHVFEIFWYSSLKIFIELTFVFFLIFKFYSRLPELCTLCTLGNQSSKKANTCLLGSCSVNFRTCDKYSESNEVQSVSSCRESEIYQNASFPKFGLISIRATVLVHKQKTCAKQRHGLNFPVQLRKLLPDGRETFSKKQNSISSFLAVTFTNFCLDFWRHQELSHLK